MTISDTRLWPIPRVGRGDSSFSFVSAFGSSYFLRARGNLESLLLLLERYTIPCVCEES